MQPGYRQANVAALGQEDRGTTDFLLAISALTSGEVISGAARRWSSATRSNVFGPILGVLLGRGEGGVGSVFFLRRFKHSLQKRTTPTAAGTGTKTLGELSNTFWFFKAQKICHLSLGDMKAEAEFVVRLHGI